MPIQPEALKGAEINKGPAMNLPEQIRAWRTRESLSQPQAAARMGISVATLRNWEQGRRTPKGLGRVRILEITKQEEGK